jgi:hypothetical protein
LAHARYTRPAIFTACLARDCPSVPFPAGHRTSPDFANIPLITQETAMRLSLQYVAGLFDGEGWVRIQTPGIRLDGSRTPGSNYRRFPSYQVIAGIAMTHKPVMVAFHEQFGGTLYGDDHYRRKDPKNRTIYRWHVQSQQAHQFLTAIVKHLLIKQDQVELAIELQDHIAKHRSAMVGPWTSDEVKAEIAAHRKALADKITELKKVNYNLPVDHGASPYRF